MRKEEFLLLKEEFEETRASYEEELGYLCSKCYRATMYYGVSEYKVPEDIIRISEEWTEYAGSYVDYLCYDLDRLIEFCCEMYGGGYRNDEDCEWRIDLENCIITGEKGEITFDGRKEIEEEAKRKGIIDI